MLVGEEVEIVIAIGLCSGSLGDSLIGVDCWLLLGVVVDSLIGCWLLVGIADAPLSFNSTESWDWGIAGAWFTCGISTTITGLSICLFSSTLFWTDSLDTPDNDSGGQAGVEEKSIATFVDFGLFALGSTCIFSTGFSGVVLLLLLLFSAWTSVCALFSCSTFSFSAFFCCFF